MFINRFIDVPNCSNTTKAKIIVARVMFFYKPMLSVDALMAINMIIHDNYIKALWATYKDLHKAV